MKLRNYSKGNHTAGASLFKQLAWYFIGSPLVQTKLLPFSSVKALILKSFGANLGKRLVIKCDVRIKYPWKLTIGDYSWIGEGVWIDNVAPIEIGSNCCISQDVYLCSGDHDLKKESFDLRLRSIRIEDRAWICARSAVAPGCHVGEGVVLTFGSIARGKLEDWHIYSGNPAIIGKKRIIIEEETSVDSQRKEILFINQSYYPDITATSQYLTDISVAFANQGHSVTVICGQRSYSIPDKLYAKSETHQGVQILRVPTPMIRGASRVVRIVNGLLMNVAFLWRLMRLPRFDTVVVMTSPPLIAWTSLFFMKAPRRSLIYWIMDLNPDQVIAAGWISAKSLSARLLNACLRSVLNRVDQIVVLDQQMKNRLVGRVANLSKIEVLPLWIDKARLWPVAHADNSFRKQHGLQDKFVVMYSGNLSLCHPIGALLDTAKRMRDDKSTIFVVIGGGHGMKGAEEFKDQHSLDNLYCLPYQERDKLRDSLSAADLHIVSMGDEYNGIIHPSKIYGILGVQRPFVLVGPDDCFMSEEFVQRGLGVRVGQDAAPALEGAIRNFKDSGSQAPAVAGNSYDQVISELEPARIFKRFESLL